MENNTDREKDLSNLTENEVVEVRKILRKEPTPPCENSKVARFFGWIDLVLGKCTRLLLWMLECAGMIWIYLSMTRFREALDMIKAAETPILAEKARIYMEAVKISAESTNTLVIALCAALPSAIGALKALRNKQKQKEGTASPG
jgi:hypothetical protein